MTTKKATKTTSQQQQNSLFDLAGAPLAPTVRTVRYGDALLTTTATGPLVGQGTTTDTTTGAHGFQPGTASDAVGTIATTTTAAPAQPVEVVAGIPDPQKPKRWHEYTTQYNGAATALRIEKLGAAVRRVLDVLSDGEEHHAAQLYAVAGGLDRSRPVRGVRELVGRTPGGSLVYAWVILLRIDSNTGAGVYRLEWRNVPQPKGDNGAGAGVGDTL